MLVYYYNFSSTCVNSEYAGISIPSSNITTVSITPGSTYYFDNVNNCIDGCNGAPTQLSGCFTSTGGVSMSRNYPAYSTFNSINLTTVDNCNCGTEPVTVYFKYCCLQNKNPQDEYFGIVTDPGIFSLGSVYLIGTTFLSACTTVVGSETVPFGVQVYQNITFSNVKQNSCNSCTATTVGCSTTPKPTPTIYFSSDTRCGNNILKRNECDPIVIFPLGVSCIGTNPTITTESNGELSLVITGGTPPYTVFWSNGSNGLFITNLSVGSYSAVVTDYYGDFTAYTTCTLTAPTPEPTPTPTPTPTPDGEPFCLTITSASNFGTSPPITTQLYFYPLSETYNDRTKYTDGNSHEVEWTLNPPPAYWNLLNAPNGATVQSTTIDDPPISGWTVTGLASGTVSANLGECPVYSNLCFSFYQTKQEQIATDQVTMVYDGTVNGQPSWQSVVINNGVPVELYRYIIYWNPTLSRWEVQILDPTNYGTQYPIVNTNPASPPISGWQQPGSYSPSDYVSVTLGNCTPQAIQEPPCDCIEYELANFPSNCSYGDASDSIFTYVDCETGLTITKRPASYNIPYFSYNNFSTTVCSLSPPVFPSGLLSCVNTSYETVVTELGTCCSTPLAFSQENSNQPTDGNAYRSATVNDNGNIVLKATKGVGPYQYSIDNGLTYRSIPIFTKLSPGTYTTIIKDSLGNKAYGTVVLNPPPKPVVYKVSLVTTTTKTRTNFTTYNNRIVVTPSLPSGATITFDFIHTNTFKTSTGQTSSTQINNSTLNKNSVPYSANTIETITSTTTNTIAGCQRNPVYVTSKTETWSSVQITNTTRLNIETINQITKNINDPCYIGDSIDNFVITNLTISGCSNCNVSNGSN